MSSTVKVYEIAADLKMDTETVLHKIRDLGINVKNKMSKVEASHIDIIKAQILKEQEASFVEVEVAPGIRKLKRVEAPAPPPRPAPPPAPVAAARPVAAPSAERPAPEPEPVAAAPVVTAAPVVEAPVVVAPAPSEPVAVAAPVAPVAEAAPVVEAPRAEPVAVAPPSAVEAAPTQEPARSEPVAARAEPEAPKAESAASRAKAGSGKTKGKTPAAEAPEAKATKPEPTVAQPPVAASTPEPVAVAEAPVSSAPVAVAPAPTPRAEAAPARPATPVAAAQAAPVAPAPAPTATPSVPPPGPGIDPATGERRTGIARWDPVSKKIVYEESNRNSMRPPMGGPGMAGRPSMPPGAPGALPGQGPGGRGRIYTVDKPTGTRPLARPGQTRPGMPGQGPGMMRGRPGFAPRGLGGPGRSTAQSAPDMAQHKKVIKIEAQISLQELARRMSIRATEVLIKLIQMGETGKNINSTLDSDTAKLLASEFGFTVEDVALNTDEIISKALALNPTVGELVTRAPVVTVMGHVDHGKTTLLDAIIGSRVAEGEAGGITQEVRAYKVATAKGPVIFFDTPGHAAFTALRARGAKLTDVAVLVVAADDGVMPTTVEAINHAKAAKVPIVVALNKMDRPDANPTKVLQQLMQHDVVPEEFGGDTLVVRVSAKARTGIEDLLESLALQNEILDLKADPKKPGIGTVFEAKLDKGRGAVARVLVQEGIVRSGDVVLVGSAYGRIRAMFDDRGKPLDKAGPSTPVEILGLSGVPNAGDKMYVCADLRKAQEVSEQLQIIDKMSRPAQQQMSGLDAIARALQKDGAITVAVVVKADAQGAVEGLKQALTQLSTDKVQVRVIHGAVGAITETDVQLASASNAVIIGFNVRPAGKAQAAADEQKVPLKFYNVIYEAVDEMKLLMVGQLKPTFTEKALGKAEVRQVFNITKTGLVAGSMVTDGLIRRNAHARLLRDGAVKWEGKISSIRRIKDDVKEVAQGFECGISLENTPDLKAGDIIEAYELEEVAATL
jgi:translation initiation factor IF-2